MIIAGTIDFALLDRAKWAFTTRRVSRADVRGLRASLSEVRAGDLILCEILKLGQHKNIQLADRRL